MKGNTFLTLVAAPGALLIGLLAGLALRSPLGVVLILLGASVAIALIYTARESGATRSRLRQAWIFSTLLASFVLGYLGMIILASIVLASPGGGPQVQNFERGRYVGTLCLLLWSGGVISTQAKKVGYRWGDVFMMFIPIFGPLVFLPKMLWRIAGLPNRAWDNASPSPLVRGSASETSFEQVDQTPPPPTVAPAESFASSIASKPPLPPLPPPAGLTAESSIEPHGTPRRDRRSPYVAVVGGGFVLLAAAIAFASTQGEGRAEPTAAPPATPEVSVAIDTECVTALDQLRSQKAKVDRMVSQTSDDLDAVERPRQKANVLDELASRLFVTGVQVESVSASEPRLGAAQNLLVAAVDEFQHFMEELAFAWREPAQANLDMDSYWKRGVRALEAADDVLYPSPC